MRFVRKFGLVLISVLSIVSLVTAQEACPTEVDDAVFALNDICFAVQRNQACYGNGDIVALPSSGTTIDFVVPGDQAPVDDIASLTLSPFEAGFDEWGVAVLVVQADIPDTLPGQNVTMLLFGDVSLSNESGAYYFTSGIGSPSCKQAPNGILIQTPEGEGEVNLTMNGIDISLGSTAYLGTLEEDILTFALLEGNATLVSEENDLVIEGGEFTTIELDEEGDVIGEFSDIGYITESDIEGLPIQFLPQEFDFEVSELAIEGSGFSIIESSNVSGDLIFPLNGTWSSNLGDFTVGSGCPPGFNSAMMQQSMAQSGYSETFVQDIDFTGLESMEEFFRLGDYAQYGISATFSNPETNVYQILMDIEGSTITYTWSVYSETHIEGEFNMNLDFAGMGSCTFSTTVVLEHQG